MYLSQENPILLKAFTDLQGADQGTQIPGIGMERYFFDVYIQEGNIKFNTRWGPYEDEMQKIALFFRTDFECNYEEGGMEIYGKMVYKNGIFTDYSLDQEDLDQIIFQLDADGEPDHDEKKMLDGEEYESYDELIEVLIDRKIKKATDAHISQTTEKDGKTAGSNS